MCGERPLEVFFVSASDSDGDAAEVARRKAKAEAASIGATHIQWIVPCCTYVEANPYQCDTPEYAQMRRSLGAA